MKKNLILALAVAAAVASCQKDMEPVSIQQATDTAISFSAYTGTAVTRGEIVTGNEVDSIGVFAFYQQNASGNAVDFNTHKFAAPNFMYNQLVKENASGMWEYSPLKYWPNNKGDQLSFFAYAPYDSTKTWEDMGISTDINAKKLTVEFPIYNEVRDQIDYLWADPQINKSNKSTSSSKLYGVADSVKFQFKHITSRIQLLSGVVQDKVQTTPTPTAWTDSSTVITIESVEFKGFFEKKTLVYDCETNTCTIDTTGTQDFKLTSANFTDSCVIKVQNTHMAAFDTLTTEEDYMFIAPQTMVDQKLVVTYTVTTTDSNNAANSSTVKNVITTNVKDVIGQFAQGKAYQIKLLIGMNQVKIAATETPWEDAKGSPYQVNVPENE